MAAKERHRGTLFIIYETIHSAWVSKKIAFLLLLDVVIAFDNVAHVRLLHNLRKRRIGGNFAAWMGSFLSERYTTLKMMSHNRATVHRMWGASRILFITYIVHTLQRRLHRTIHQIHLRHNGLGLHRRCRNHDGRKHGRRQFAHVKSRSRFMHRVVSNPRLPLRRRKIRICSWSFAKAET